MYYVVNLSIPINTPEATPLSAMISPVERLIKEVQIVYLDDPTTVGVRILDGSSRPAIPSSLSPGRWLLASGVGIVTIPADEIALSGSPYLVTVEAYNTSASVAVDIQLRFVIVNLTLFTSVQGILAQVTKALDALPHLIKKENGK